MFAASKTASVSGGYQIQRSLRFNSADSAYLNRTPASAGNRTTWTWSAWIKRSGLSTEQHLFEANSSEFYLVSSGGSTPDSIVVRDNATNYLITSQVFRDVSAWYHIVLTWDSSNATAGDRVRLYVNGSRVTAFGTTNNPTLNATSSINSTNAHFLGEYYGGGSYYYNGYMTEVNFIDGQALTPSSFGETNAQTGVWQPKAYSGSYGTNGFYLNFSDNSNTTAATLGKDYSGNGNNWTPNNFSVTAGAGNDSLVDSPTSYGTDTGAGGTVRGNYCTLNPLTNTGGASTLSNGNLDIADTSTYAPAVIATIAMSSGKWYWEVTLNSANCYVGVATPEARASVSYLGEINGQFMYNPNGASGCYINGSSYNYTTGSSATTGDVIGVALNFDSDNVVFYKNGVSMGTFSSGLLTGKTFLPAFKSNNTANATFNFGQRPFAYTAPSGYKALCTQNLPTPTIGATSTTLANKYFAPVLYTGNGSTQSVTVGFQPDWIWLKNRSAYGDNGLYDVLRGTTKRLVSNSANAEDTISGVTAFNSSGFTLGADYNSNADSFISWNWKANGSGSTNTSGSITSTVSANTTSGFSVVTYTGLGGAGNSVGHGLGAVPQMIIVKQRASATNYNWFVYHQAIGNTQYLLLNYPNPTSSGVSPWNNQTPTSSVFYLGSYGEVNQNGNTFVAYCFAEVAGYSKFGSYTGNGSSDGPFTYTGFRPAYVMIKSTGTGSWCIYDASRNPSNVVDLQLFADTTQSEAAIGSSTFLDILSNGFKNRNTATDKNSAGSTYIYMAFASNPFKYSLAR